MTSILKSVQKNALLRSTAYILFGIALTVNPLGVSKIILNIIVAYNIIMGIFSLFSGIKNRETDNGTGIGISIFYFLCALLIFLFAKPIISILPILLGISFVIGGAMKIMQSLNLKQYVNVNYVPMLFYGVFLIIAGVLLVTYSFSTVMVFFRVVGILLVISGISELITFIRYRNYDL